MTPVVHFPTIEPFLNRTETAKVLGISLRTLDRFVSEALDVEVPA